MKIAKTSRNILQKGFATLLDYINLEPILHPHAKIIIFFLSLRIQMIQKYHQS